MKPHKREQYQQEHRDELALFDVAAVFLKSLKESGEAITPKAWRAEAVKLAAQKDMDYQKMRAMRDEIKAVESLRKAADHLAQRFIIGMTAFDRQAEMFARMSYIQSEELWNSAVAVTDVIRAFSKKVHHIKDELQQGDRNHEN